MTRNQKTFLHPGRQAKVTYEGKEIGYLGEVHPEVCDAYSIGTRAYIAVIDIPSVLEFATFDRKYKGIAKFPAVSRDLSMVVPKAVSAGQIEDMIRQRGGKIMESCELFDIYEEIRSRKDASRSRIRSHSERMTERLRTMISPVR